MTSDKVMIGLATLYLGKWQDVLPHVGTADLLCTDPPYPDLKGGIAFKSSKRGSSGVGEDAGETLGDTWGASLDYLSHAWAASERGFMTFCTHHSLGDIQLRMREIGADYLGFTIWNKPNAPHPARPVPRYSSEYIMRFRKAPGLDWRKLDDSVISMNGLQAGCMASPERLLKTDSKAAAHPAQKPIALMRKLLSVRPTSVMDLYMGTGTTGIAAVSMHIPFIGIEEDESYFELAVKRFRDAQGGLI